MSTPMLPVLCVEFLEEEQVIYECQIRHLAYHPYTRDVVDRVRIKINSYVGDPSQIVYIDSPAGHEKELNKCVVGFKNIIVKYNNLSHAQR